MSDEPEDLPPYTGRPASPVSDDLAVERYGVAPVAPRVRWRRATLVQLGAGTVVGFAVPAIALQGYNFFGTLPILLVAGLAIGIIGGGLPLLGAWITWLVVSRSGRGRGREVAAVVGGAMVGALPVSLLTFGFWNNWEPVLITILLIGVPSAIGFTIWVLLAWRRHPAPEQPADSLN